jgi:hypothetical protein
MQFLLTRSGEVATIQATNGVERLVGIAVDVSAVVDLAFEAVAGKVYPQRRPNRRGVMGINKNKNFIQPSPRIHYISIVYIRKQALGV